MTVDGEVVGSIGKGLMCLVGVQRDDNAEDARWITSKILKTRLFEVDSKSWAGSVETLGLEVLLVSQFTLYGVCSKGTKPDFHRQVCTQAVCSTSCVCVCVSVRMCVCASVRMCVCCFLFFLLPSSKCPAHLLLNAVLTGQSHGT